MTITNQTVDIVYPGDGVTTSWAFNFLIPTVDGAPAVSVYTVDPSGNRTLLTPNLYGVIGADNPVGGLVTYSPALPLNWQLVIQRSVPPKQEEAFSNQSFLPEDVEQGLDYGMMVLQQHQEILGRTLRGPPGESFAWLPPAALRKGKALQFDPVTGAPIVVTPGGAGPGSTDWTNLTSIPPNVSAFAALNGSADQVAYFTGAGAFSLAAFTAQGRNVVAQVTYAAMLSLLSPLTSKGDVMSSNGTVNTRVPVGTNGQVLSADSTQPSGLVWITIGTGGAPTWASITSKPANVVSFAALTSAVDTMSYFTDNVGSMNTFTATAFSRGLMAQTNAAGWKAALGVSGTGTPPFNPLTTYGAVEDGITNDLTAINTWLADATQHRVWLENTSFFNAAATILNKRMMGPGKLIDATGDKLPADFMWLQASPTRGTGVDANYFFSGDLSHVDAQYFILGGNSNPTNLRIGVTEPYYESVTTPKFVYFTNNAGASGTTCHVAVASIAGATTMQVDTTASIVSGQTLGFYDANGNIAETKAVTVVDGTHISWTGGLANAYPQYRGLGLGKRTINPFGYYQINHNGYGDAYVFETRLNVNTPAKPGQVHFAEVATVGSVGGDVNHGASHTFSTPHEWLTYDNGFDVAHMTMISSFVRTINTGAFSEVWFGLSFKSTGAVAIDAFAVFAGKSRTGIDMSFCDFSTNSNSAIQFAMSHRIYWGASVTVGGAGYKQSQYGYAALYSNTVSDMWITMTNDGTTDFFQIKLGTTFLDVKRSGAVLTNGILLVANSADISGGVSVEGGGHSGQAAYGFYAGSGTSIEYNPGTNKFEFWRLGVLITTI